MVKTKTQQPQPQMDAPVAPIVPEAGQPTHELEVRQKGGKPSLMAAITADNAKRLADKQRLLGEATQLLAQAKDAYGEGGNVTAEAEETAARAGFLLYQGRIDGLLNAEEVSNALGNQFGFKVTSTGKPSKTPAGAGEGIRKRVVRLVGGYEYANDIDAQSFFEPLDKDDVNDIIRQVGNDDGQITVWQAYDKLAEMRKEALAGTRPELVFDARRIAGLATKLGQSIEASAKHFADDSNLVEAWAAVRDMLAIVDEAAARIVQERAE
jgi:hypothetical protein